MTGGSAWDQVPELALLHDCLQAIVRPDDPVALLTVLRGELFGFSDQALYDFRKAGGRFSFHAKLPTNLNAATAELFADAFERLQSYHHWLTRLPPLAAIESIVADLGLIARAAATRGGNVQAGALAKALEWLRAAQVDLHSPVQLVEHLGSLIESGVEFDAVPARPHLTPPVRLMNLHKVKGLEAPVVYLVDPSGASSHPVDIHIDRSRDRVEGYLAVCVRRGDYGTELLACAPGWPARESAEDQFQEAEESRLLYVAATRAGTQLSITQRDKRNDHNPWQFFAPHLQDCQAVVDPPVVDMPATVFHSVTEAEADTASAAIAERFRQACQPSYVRQRVRDSLEASHISERVGQEHGTEWGTVVHRLLEAAMRSPGADLTALAHDNLREQDLDIEFVDEAVDLIHRVMSSAVWKRASAGRPVLTEVPIRELRPQAGLPTLQNGVIDLAFREADGWVIVDYKTDRQPNSALAGLVDTYRPQVSNYMAIWRRLTGEPAKEMGIYFTHLDRYTRL